MMYFFIVPSGDFIATPVAPDSPKDIARAALPQGGICAVLSRRFSGRRVICRIASKKGSPNDHGELSSVKWRTVVDRAGRADVRAIKDHNHVPRRRSGFARARPTDELLSGVLG